MGCLSSWRKEAPEKPLFFSVPSSLSIFSVLRFKCLQALTTTSTSVTKAPLLPLYIKALTDPASLNYPLFFLYLIFSLPSLIPYHPNQPTRPHRAIIYGKTIEWLA